MTAPSDLSLSADVVIVGAGAAGAAAALSVIEAGRTFVGLDGLPAFGGTAATSGGGVCVAGTPFQREHGITDSPEQGLRDHLEVADGEADEDWARFYYDHAVDDVYGWLLSLGVEFVVLNGHEETTVPRWHGPRGSGRGLMDALWRAISEAGAADAWHFGVSVDEVIVEGGRAAGVAGRTADGQRVVARGDAVVVATGGFAGSPDEVLSWAPLLATTEGLLVGGGIGATGRGHRLLLELGAEVVNPANLWIYAHATPDPRDATHRRGLVVRGLESAIWVNRAGRRFHDESLVGPGSATRALLGQEGATCWAILDRPMLERIRIADPLFRGGDDERRAAIDWLVEASADIAVGESPHALAEAAGLDTAAFAATFSAWGELLRSGASHDPATGRALAGVTPYGPGPYYAVRFVPLVRKCLGGIRTDLRGRVLRGGQLRGGQLRDHVHGDHVLRGCDCSVIPGLYAAGELAGFGGGHLAGRRAPEGIMIGGSLLGGRLAGAWAAHEAGADRPARWEVEVAAG